MSYHALVRCNNLKINSHKTKAVVILHNVNDSDFLSYIRMDNAVIDIAKLITNLEFIINSRLSADDYVYLMTVQMHNILRKMRLSLSCVPPPAKLGLIKCLVVLLVSYGAV